ncbi:hypothetical protein BS78_K338000 [Paspalum vaginatum]|uniref:At1g61320/AtMIF1 LRR domain-containing protein n=1 Tax=Paspalum vaginatum TaxID=158149 RepID=A0A9W7XAX5_9POAL|nr:hypothetical protein BS78_K338000 [Paspalum vaginatum]
MGEELGARSGISLPGDLVAHIHSFMSMRDAARAACVSHAFLRSWRFYPKLNLNMETFDDLHALFDSDPSEVIDDDQIRRRGGEDYFRKNNRVVKGFIARVDHIMRNHAGTGITKFRVQPPLGFYIDPAAVDRWSAAIMEQPGIKDFELELAPVYDDELYSFPCSLLLSATTIASLTLSGCSFRSLDSLAGSSLTSLTRVHLHNMRVGTEEVRRFLSSCPALEDLILSCCHQMVCFEMPPRLLPRLKSLLVYSCSTLLTIRCDAPKLQSFQYVGPPTIQISSLLAGATRSSSSCVRGMKIKSIDQPGMLCYAATKLQLPTIAPNLIALSLSSCFETADTPMVIGKFCHLMYLDIHIREASRCPDYDFCSLVSLLDASPSLDTFILKLEMPDPRSDSIAIPPAAPDSSSQEKGSNSRHVATAGGPSSSQSEDGAHQRVLLCKRHD